MADERGMGRGDVEETLGVIRRLMERGQVYEAISARSAVLTGLCALAAAAGARLAGADDAAFVTLWLVLAAAAACWTLLPPLAGSAAGADRPRRTSPQARAVLRAVLPAYGAAAALTWALWRAGRVDLLPATWCLLHGLAILATSYHAPRRLVGLGLAFLAAGALAAAAPVALLPRDLVMAATFGALHLGYGLIGLRQPPPAD